MNEQKNDKWLDELISRTINTTKQQFDPEKWQQKYPDEFELLKSRAKKTPAIIQPSMWKIVLQSKLTKLAAAAVIIVVISIFVFHRGAREQEPPQVVSVSKSPAEMLTVASLRTAYRRGGIEALEKQCDEAIEKLGPRNAKLSIQELLAEFNGT